MTLHKIKASAATVYGCGRANTKLRKSHADDIPYLDLASVGNKGSVGPKKEFYDSFFFLSQYGRRLHVNLKGTQYQVRLAVKKLSQKVVAKNEAEPGPGKCVDVEKIRT